MKTNQLDICLKKTFSFSLSTLFFLKIFHYFCASKLCNPTAIGLDEIEHACFFHLFKD